MGSNWGAHSTFPCFPVSLPLGKGEAGSYPLPALKLGKLNSRTPLVSIEILKQPASRLSPIVRFVTVSCWKHTKYSFGRYPTVEGIGVVGTVADDVFKEPGIVNDVELAPILAGTLAHNAGECRNNMLQPGSDSLRDPVPGGLDPGQESEWGTGLFRVALPKAGTGSHFR